MFSFIKWFENLLKNSKKNKGLWFTILTIGSLGGIFISLYFVNFLVSDVAKKTYQNQRTHYLLESKSLFEMCNRVVLSTATGISQNANIHLLFQSNDENKTLKLSNLAMGYTNKLNENLNSKYYRVDFKYSNKPVDTKNLNGLRVYDDGLYFFAKTPLAEHENVRLELDVNEKINSLNELLTKENKEFMILLNSGAISQVSAQVKNEQYQKIFDEYYVNKRVFNSEFIQDVAKVDFKQFVKEGYIKDLNYFFVYDKAYDYKGQEIGIVVIGEKISQENSFVNLIKNLVNSVTIVALGLIVSIILFLF